MTIVTLYTNLGDDGIIHAISETEVSTVICSYETFGKLCSVLNKDGDKVPCVKNIVVMEDLAGKPIDPRKVPEGQRGSSVSALRRW